MAKYQSLESSIRNVVADTLRELEESVQQSEAEDAKCGEGQYWCNTDQKCKPIPDGMKVDGDGMLVKEEVEQVEEAVMSPVKEEKNCGCGQNPCKTYGAVEEKTLTPAEKKKREEVAKAIERDNPKMPMDKKMAIATATAKKVAESSVSDRTKRLIERAINRKS